MIQPFGASIAKVCAIPQPRRAYTPASTFSATFESVTPSRAFASRATGVVTAPFGPVTVSVRRDGLVHDAGAVPAAGSAVAVEKAAAAAIEAAMSSVRNVMGVLATSASGTKKDINAARHNCPSGCILD